MSEFEKYGVLEDPEITKQADTQEKKCCPKCGAELVPIEFTNVLKCPQCGTQPWESRNE